MAEITIDTRTPARFTGCTGSGPFYNVTFTTNYSTNIRLLDFAYMDHRQNRWLNQPGPHLSMYKYQVTALAVGTHPLSTVTLKWISATNSYADASPCTLGDGTASAYDNLDGQADVVFKREIGDGNTFLMFVDY
jgi:hypothetical protein